MRRAQVIVFSLAAVARVAQAQPEEETSSLGSFAAEASDDVSRVPNPPLVLSEPVRPSPVTEERLRAHLEVRAVALREGDRSGAELALGLLEESRQALGAANAILPAVVLLDEARRAQRDNDLRLALDRCRRALRLAPDLLAAHWAHLKLLVEVDSAQVARIVQAAGHMGGAWVRGFRNQVHLVTLLSAALLIGSALSLALGALSLLARHLRYQAHDLSRGLPKVLGPGEVLLLLVLAILLPGVLGLGWPSSIALALSLTLVYQTRRERVLSVLGIGFICALPWIASLAAPLVAFNGSRVDHLARVMEEAFVASSESTLKAHLRRQPDDALAALVLGIRAARRSDFKGAQTLLQMAVAAHPHDAQALNNLGVVDYQMGLHERAERHFKAALRLQADAEPALNLSLIASDRGDFESAETYLRTARSHDPQLVEQTLAKAGLPMELRIRLGAVPTSRLWKELYRLDERELGATRAQLWHIAAGRMQPWSIPALGLLALAVGMLGFRSRDRSVPCVRCGAAALEDVRGAHCSQCRSVFLGLKPIPRASRVAKERQVYTYQRMRVWLSRLTAVVPGLSALLYGRTISGFIQLNLFCVLISLSLVREGLAFHAWHVPGDGTGSWIILVSTLSLAALLSVLSLRSAFRR